MAHLQEERLIAGCVAEKKGYLYWVLYPYVNGVRKPKWISTKMRVKGNKTQVKNMLPEVRREWTQKYGVQAVDAQSSLAVSAADAEIKPIGKKGAESILFLEWIYHWWITSTSKPKGRSWTKRRSTFTRAQPTKEL